MRHATRIWFPTVLIVVLGAMGSGAPVATSSAGNSGPPKAKAVTAGVDHTCALTRTGAVMCWGYNGHDELGTGQGGNLPWASIPVDVQGLSGGVTMVSAGARHSCAVTGAGGAMCWGANYGGALGDGTEDRHFAPVEVIGLRGGQLAVSAGYDRSCALVGSGGVQCWGTGYGHAPIDINGLSNGVIGLSAGVLISCAITAPGGVKCWGYHYGGTPVDVPGLSGVTALAAGGPLCALANGGVKCWSADSGWSPVDVPGLAGGVRAIDSSGGHACALMSTGGVKCWGLNDRGQLGDGTTTDRPTPVDVAGLSGGVAIATGGFHSCAVLGNGGVKCWGANGAGQLGDGSRVDRLRPVRVFFFGPPPARCVVPSVVGKRLAKARLAVRHAHCGMGRVLRIASTKAKGVVVHQSPRPGRRLKAGSTVNLIVSRGR